MSELNEVFQLIARLFRVELVAMLLTLPRMHAFLSASLVLSPSAVSGMVRNVCILSLSLVVVPVNMVHAAAFDGSYGSFALLFAKEYIIGFLLGYIVSWVFWAVQAAGALIDNQRGAAIASSIDPMQGHEASPLGLMFSHVFITYVYVTGAMLPLFGLIYHSYAVWPVTAMLPVISDTFPAFMMGIMDQATRFIVILAGPVVAVMFLAEFALAMVSRFAPQIQVFVLAMPIKSILAIFMLIFYLPVMLRYSVVSLDTVREYTGMFYQIFAPAPLR